MRTGSTSMENLLPGPAREGKVGVLHTGKPDQFSFRWIMIVINGEIINIDALPQQGRHTAYNQACITICSNH